MYAKPSTPAPLKFLIILIIAIELVAIGCLAYARSVENTMIGPGANPEQSVQATAVGDAPATDAAEGDSATPAPEPVSLTVTFAGDCTLGTDVNYDNSRSFNSRWESEEADATYFLRNVAELFGADDLTVVNMEGVLTEGGERADKSFAFRGKPEYAKIFSSASVEAATLANNHSADYGQSSYDDTIAALDAEGVKSFGYDRIAYLDVKGVKVALVGAYFPEDSEDNQKQMTDNIAAARAEGAQLVLVYVHWGLEHEYDITEDQMKMGHAAIDAGADLVVGSHPHVVQGWEVYQGRYIVYSLGNFCFGGNTNPDDKDCLIFQQTFTVTGNDVAKDDKVDFIACSVSSETDRNTYQPTLAEGDEKARIDQKVADAAERVAAMAAQMAPAEGSGEGEDGGEGDSTDDSEGASE